MKKVAIVGSHPDTRQLAPYDDLGWEIWLFNEAAQKPEIYRRWDLLLQIHDESVYSSTQNWVNKDHWEWLQQDHGISQVTGNPKRIMMHARDERVPNSEGYPLEEVLGLSPYRYLRSSPAIALALAIYEGYEAIQLYGSELSSNTEYKYQAINYAFWIGLAHGRGVDLDLRCWQSEFCNQRLYGFEGEFELDRATYVSDLLQAQEAFETNENILTKLNNKFELALIEAKFDRAGDLSVEMEDAAILLGEAEGIQAETAAYAGRVNPISRQEFERRSAQAQKDGEDANRKRYMASGRAEYVWNIWRQTGRVEAREQMRRLTGEKVNLAREVGRLKGIYGINIQYMSEYDDRLTAAGGVRALGREG